MSLASALQDAEKLLPGTPVDEGTDPRWQAIIRIGEYLESDPERVWQFIAKWGGHAQEDLRDAIATCLLEHLLQQHFDRYFPLVDDLAENNAWFADTFLRCWKFGESEEPHNSKRWDDLCLRLEGKQS
jgi:hypothetical protein